MIFNNIFHSIKQQFSELVNKFLYELDLDWITGNNSDYVGQGSSDERLDMEEYELSYVVS